MATARPKKISELTVAANLAATDLLVVAKTSGNTFTTNSVSFLVLANTVIGNSTPANSTITIAQGKVLYDTNYLYIAVANNTLKRVALSSF